MKRITALTLACASAASSLLLLYGCGGAGGGGAKQTGSPFAAKVTWPERTRLIPKSADSIKVWLSGNGLNKGPVTLNRPASGSDLTVVYRDFSDFGDLPAGEYTVTAKSYSTGDVDHALSEGKQVLEVQAGEETNLDINMAGTLDRFLVHGLTKLIDPSSSINDDYVLSVAGWRRVGDASSTPYLRFPNRPNSSDITFTPQDKDGNMILVAKSAATLDIVVGSDASLTYTPDATQQTSVDEAALSGTLAVTPKAAATTFGIRYQDGSGTSSVDTTLSANIAFTNANGLTVDATADNLPTSRDGTSLSIQERNGNADEPVGLKYETDLVASGFPSQDGVLDHNRTFDTQLNLLLNTTSPVPVPVAFASNTFNLQQGGVTVSFDFADLARDHQLIQNYPSADNSYTVKRGTNLTIQQIVAKVASKALAAQGGSVDASTIPSYAFPVANFQLVEVKKKVGSGTPALIRVGTTWEFTTTGNGTTSKDEETDEITFRFTIKKKVGAAYVDTACAGGLVDATWDGIGKITVTIKPNGGTIGGGVG